MAFQEESSRSLLSDEQRATEPKTVLPDGSYSTGPRVLAGLTAARFEHCLVRPLGCPAAQLLRCDAECKQQKQRQPCTATALVPFCNRCLRHRLPGAL